MIDADSAVELAEAAFPATKEVAVVGVKGETPVYYVIERMAKDPFDLPILLVHKESGQILVAYLPRDRELFKEFTPYE